MALEQINSEVAIEDRDEELQIDHDTKGLPDIVQAILDKIDSSEVFVADITPIAVSETGKHLANPNVLIELGYAKKSRGTGRLITVWNTFFTNCGVEDLPFDLRGKRGPIEYRLEPGADKRSLSEARQHLKDRFFVSLKSCFDEPANSEPQMPEWKPSIEGDPSIWISPGTRIPVNEGFASGTKKFSVGNRWYVRIIPASFDPNAMDEGAYMIPAFSGGGWHMYRLQTH